MSQHQRKFFLAIRHRPTGGLLPSVKGYGFTRTRPTTAEPPRLFTRIGPAKQALARWLEGEMYEGELDEENSKIDIRCIYRPERRPQDMEIVEIEVIVRSLSEAQLRSL